VLSASPGLTGNLSLFLPFRWNCNTLPFPCLSRRPTTVPPPCHNGDTLTVFPNPQRRKRLPPGKHLDSSPPLSFKVNFIFFCYGFTPDFLPMFNKGFYSVTYDTVLYSKLRNLSRVEVTGGGWFPFPAIVFSGCEFFIPPPLFLRLW